MTNGILACPNRRTPKPDALQAEVDALKRMQAETPVNHTGQAAAEVDALLPSILHKAFGGEL